MSALKSPRLVVDSTHLDRIASTTPLSIARQHWVDRHAPYSPVPVLNSSPSPVGRAVARSMLLFWRERIDARFSSAVAIVVGGDDPDLLLQAGALRAFSSTLVLTTHLHVMSVNA